jgi:hypothetical protein
VTAAFDGDEKIIRARKLHRANNVRDSRTAGDQAGLLIDARIPDASSRSVAGVAPQQRLPVEFMSERLDGRPLYGGAIAPPELRSDHVVPCRNEQRQ